MSSVGELTIATLNHDVVLERAFAFAGVKISDGFEKTFGTLEIWNDQFSTPNSEAPEAPWIDRLVAVHVECRRLGRPVHGSRERR